MLHIFLTTTKFFSKGPEFRNCKSKENRVVLVIGSGSPGQRGVAERQGQAEFKGLCEKARSSLISSLCGPPGPDVQVVVGRTTVVNMSSCRRGNLWDA